MAPHNNEPPMLPIRQLGMGPVSLPSDDYFECYRKDVAMYGKFVAIAPKFIVFAPPYAHHEHMINAAFEQYPTDFLTEYYATPIDINRLAADTATTFRPVDAGLFFLRKATDRNEDRLLLSDRSLVFGRGSQDVRRLCAELLNTTLKSIKAEIAPEK